ncbi:hypothetical protein [Bacillus weihaiensis]|uniref:hypothetical protein n=1 Tax=Bacillus weihaiensis TaxID=1547283 RepID=UPI002352A67D|nr:hypothetical protein [Bacillus weihaiensis]
MKFKRRMILLIIMFFIIGITIYINSLEKKTVSQKEELVSTIDYSKIKGILIYSNWTGDISAYSQEEIRIQIPVYDFNNELGSYSVNVENFNIGEVKDYKLTLQNDFPEFKQYTLDFVLIPTKEGIHNIKDLKVIIKTNKREYKETIGNWVFNISKPLINSDPLRIEGGSIFTDWKDETDTLEYRSQIRNNSSEIISLVSIENNIKEISFSKKSINTNIQPDKKLTVESNVNISKTLENVYLKPRLLYSINNKDHSIPLNLTLFASPIPTSELNKLLIERNMLEE